MLRRGGLLERKTRRALIFRRYQSQRRAQVNVLQFVFLTFLLCACPSQTGVVDLRDRLQSSSWSASHQRPSWVRYPGAGMYVGVGEGHTLEEALQIARTDAIRRIAETQGLQVVAMTEIDTENIEQGSSSTTSRRLRSQVQTQTGIREIRMIEQEMFEELGVERWRGFDGTSSSRVRYRVWIYASHQL
jgi:hypothetical protein